MATAKKNSTSEMSSNLSASLDDHLSQLKAKITQRALEIAAASIPPMANEDDEPASITVTSLARAVDEVTNGLVTSSDGFITSSEPRMKFFDLFPPFTCVCAVLCLAFATLGLFPLLATDPLVAAKVGSQAAGFLDIAKIFAGAIVGSTTSIALGSSKSKRVR